MDIVFFTSFIFHWRAKEQRSPERHLQNRQVRQERQPGVSDNAAEDDEDEGNDTSGRRST